LHDRRVDTRPGVAHRDLQRAARPWRRRARDDPARAPFGTPGEAQAFDLLSLGKDGQAGGDSYNADIKFE
ncbi:MAG: type II secretion system protein GspG, partial [Pseudoxanthomonas sp.]|nr:type II secretion system protein GspG [Pseudoxanthomonas sp.]